MRIGWASTDVTPERPVALQGQFHVRISESVNDPLLATALALESSGGEAQAVMVSCDRAGIPVAIQQRVREAVAARLPELEPRSIFLNATHTHTAPVIEEGVFPPQDPCVMTGTEYADLFVARVADCVARAWRSRAPGGVSWGFGHAVVGHNRRIAHFGGASQMYGRTDREDFEHVEGYEDHGVDFLFTWNEEGALTGMIINLACPSQVTENALYVSADFWHEVRIEVAKRHGSDVFLLPQCSAAGDQSPHLLLHKAAEARARELRGVTEREEIARRIAAAVDDVLPLAQADIRRDAPLHHVARTVDLPARRITPGDYENAVRLYRENEARQPDPADARAVSHRFVMLRRYQRVMDAYRTQGENPVYPVELHLARLGDVAFATNPFELFLDFGLRIKARCRAAQTFVVQLAGPGSYLPTARAVAGVGYGAAPVDNRVGPEGGQVLVEATLETLNAMW
ncbi:MAG: hypothetical protein HY321_09250 [Armatimonadetes bacterium]|nr:hypothetical protein [Armatimonadota bacterium]